MRHWRTSFRSGRLLTATALVVAIWLTLQAAPTPARVVALAFMLAAIAAFILASGIVARDFESGVMVLDRLHGARPAEIMVSALAAIFTMALSVLVLVTVVNFARDPGHLTWWTMGMFGVAALALLSWCALLVALGAALPGHGNLAAAAGLMILAITARDIERGSASEVIKGVARLLRLLLPTPHQIAPVARAFDNGDFPAAATAVLALGLIAAGAIALLVLDTREPAGGWRR